MRRLFLRFSLAGFAASILGVAQTDNAAPKAPKLSADELKKLMAGKKKLFFLDVREPNEIKELGTMKGYVNIPVGQLEQRLGEIPKGALVVTA